MRIPSLFIGAAVIVVASGCASWSEPANNREGQNRFWELISPDSQRRILGDHYDRHRLLKEMGPPAIDEGEEWVYVGKYEHSSGINAGMLMAITASLHNPVWKTVIVTFSPSGFV